MAIQETMIPEAQEWLRRAMQVKNIATINTGVTEGWHVRIRVQAGERFEISGRGTSMFVYITEANGQYLVVEMTNKRAGLVPQRCSEDDIMDYVGIDNRVDAITLATAVRWLGERGLIPKQPQIDA
ncbi:hypothetical protein GJ688_01880 [Heliobacillus mobilis]|uniref:Uncharacterized protein n=1 Tax=Heliobacterium mobile TaxID=28064 RepID=A0A6I3SGD1_HELMO|nr:hypothetical protein [Heliobacterium mobile]MTV47731.1 hypothetical protein [Heliobacterium mobile]